MQQQQQQKQQAAQARGKTGQQNDAVNAKPKEIQDDEDEEEGRTSLGKKKQHTQPKQIAMVEAKEDGIEHEDTTGDVETNTNDNAGPQTPTIPTIPTISSNKRKKTGKVSYLDELLQDRKRKKKRAD